MKEPGNARRHLKPVLPNPQGKSHARRCRKSGPGVKRLGVNGTHKDKGARDDNLQKIRAAKDIKAPTNPQRSGITGFKSTPSPTERDGCPG
jgi:hypothetical protein